MAACAQPTLEPGCQTNSDCGGDERCVEGLCIEVPVVIKDADATVPPIAEGLENDAGITPLDSGTYADAAATDAEASDTGTEMDAGQPSPEDAGTDPDAGVCSGVTVEIQGRGVYCSLPEAIEAAQPGDVLLIPPGRFDGSISLTKGITLHGAGETTVLAGAGAPTVSVLAAGVVLEDLSIENASADGVMLSAQAEIRRVRIGPAVDNGIWIQAGGNLTGEDLTIENISTTDSSGIYVVAGGVGVVSTSVIHGVSDGVDVIGGDLTLYTTELYGNVWDGAYLEGGRLDLEAGCDMHDNPEAGVLVYDGVLVMRGSSSHDNAGEEGDGFAMIGATSWEITDSSFTNNGGFGLYCDSPSPPPVACTNVVHTNNNAGTNCACP